MTALLSARDRMECLFDAGSLRLLPPARAKARSSQAPGGADGDVLVGFGVVDGRRVACYAQDARVAGGALGGAQTDAIVRLLRLAGRTHAPVVSFLESAGARIEEGAGGLAGYARMFREIVELSGRVPQISIVSGACAGGSAYAPALTDFTIMTEPAAMFLTGPRVIGEICGEVVSVAELGGSRVHRGNGVCQLVAADELEAAAQARRLLAYLRRDGEPVPAPIADARPGPDDPGSLLPARPSAPYDVRDVVAALTDRRELLEVDARWAPNLVTGFARIAGRAIGLVANQPRRTGGVIDAPASEKAAGFVGLCDRHGLPLVVLVDTPGFMPGARQESEGIIRRGAAIVRAFAAARVPRYTVVLRKAFGGGFIAMNSAHLGATLALAWPDAEIGVMDARSAVGLIHRAELEEAIAPESLLRSLTDEYRREHCNAARAARRGFIDAVIAPAQTRARLARALATSTDARPARIGALEAEVVS